MPQRPPVPALMRRIALFCVAAACVLATGAALAVDVRPADPKLALPAFDTPEGGPFNFSDVRGRVQVVNFWAAWCEPCRKELPALERMAASMKDQPVDVVLVNLGDSQRLIHAFLKKYPVALPIHRDADSRLLTGAWNIKQLPATLVVDQQGRARWVAIGQLDEQAEPVRSRVTALLKERKAVPASAPR